MHVVNRDDGVFMPEFSVTSEKLYKRQNLPGTVPVESVRASMDKEVNYSKKESKAAVHKPESFLLPPPEVLWAWLSYIYHCTGEWVMPPATPDSVTAFQSSTHPT